MGDTLRDLIEGGESIAAVRTAYSEHKGAHPDLFGKTSLEAVNTLGYELLEEGPAELAVEVFRLKSESYPGSGNAWDSFAEAVLATGDREGAAHLYRKSLEVDPGNDSARRMLEELVENR